LHTKKESKKARKNNKNTQKTAAFLYFQGSSAFEQGQILHITCKI
jgi:hypothetical protein